MQTSLPGVLLVGLQDDETLTLIPFVLDVDINMDENVLNNEESSVESPMHTVASGSRFTGTWACPLATKCVMILTVRLHLAVNHPVAPGSSLQAKTVGKQNISKLASRECYVHGLIKCLTFLLSLVVNKPVRAAASHEVMTPGSQFIGKSRCFSFHLCH